MFTNWIKQSELTTDSVKSSNLSQFVWLLFNSTLVFTFFSYVIIGMQMFLPFFYTRYLGEYDSRQMGTIIFIVAYAWAFYLIVPFILSKSCYKETPADLGLVAPKNKYVTLFLVTGALLVLAPNIFYFAKLKQFQVSYSLGNPSLGKFIFIQIVLVPLYYFAEEFFFRGFLFFGLWRRVGWHSFWITDILFTYAHLGKPFPEIVLAVPASVVLNYLTLKTRSIYPAVFVHASLGALLNILLYYKFSFF